MPLPIPSDINSKVQELRQKYGTNQPGAQIDKIIYQARTDKLPDSELNLLITDFKNLQSAKSSGFMGGISQTLHNALGIASNIPQMNGAIQGAQRVGQVIGTGVQNLQGAGQQIAKGAQNISQAVTSPNTYVNENGVSVPSQGGRDVMNRVSQAGMGIMDIASGAGQAALTPYVAPMGAVNQELGAAAQGYSEAWKALPEKVKIVLKNVPVSPVMPGLSWGDAINQINSLPNDIKEVVMEGITAISGAATVPTTIEMGKKAFNAADSALQKEYSFGDSVKLKDGTTTKILGQNPAGGYYASNKTDVFGGDTITIKPEDIQGPLSQGIDKVKGAVKGLANDVKGEAMMPIGPDVVKKGSIISYNDGRPGHIDVKAEVLSKTDRGMVVQFSDRADTTNIKFSDKEWMDNLSMSNSKTMPSLGGELKLPKRLQSLKVGDVVNIKGELATVTGSSNKGLEVEFFSDGSKDTVVNFDSVAKAGAKEVAKVAKGLKLSVPKP